MENEDELCYDFVSQVEFTVYPCENMSINKNYYCLPEASRSNHITSKRCLFTHSAIAEHYHSFRVMFQTMC